MFKKVLEFYTKYFAIWVLVFGIIAYFAPGPFVALKSYNKLFFGLTMFGIGAVLHIEDFQRIAKKNSKWVFHDSGYNPLTQRRDPK